MDTKPFLEKVGKYKEALAQIAENRKLWKDKTKDLIYDTLVACKSGTDLDWQVQKVERIENLQAVNIHFNKQPSGFVEHTNSGVKAHVKKGAALCFSQAYNGQIFIIYSYPHVDEWVEQLADKTVEKMAPSVLTEDFIVSHLGKFLTEMTFWESSNMSTRIGFTTGAHV
jgi:hypothetical protein